MNGYKSDRLFRLSTTFPDDSHVNTQSTMATEHCITFHHTFPILQNALNNSNDTAFKYDILTNEEVCIKENKLRVSHTLCCNGFAWSKHQYNIFAPIYYACSFILYLIFSRGCPVTASRPGWHSKFRIWNKTTKRAWRSLTPSILHPTSSSLNARILSLNSLNAFAASSLSTALNVYKETKIRFPNEKSDRPSRCFLLWWNIYPILLLFARSSPAIWCIVQ